MNYNDIFTALTEDIERADLSNDKKERMLSNILKLKAQKINILITGATGSGKSSTINALFNTEKAKVGTGSDPQTQDIEKYELGNIMIWDSPGLGDGKEADDRHAKNIVNKLHEKDSDGNALIDLVLVILDGGSKDLGTSFELITSVIIPNLGNDAKKRILVAINQADMAMKGSHWDREKNMPDDVLVKFLDEKAKSVKKRIESSTGVSIEPMYYCAGYKEDGMPQNRPYNLSKLLLYIIENTPVKKRVSLFNEVKKDPEMWKDHDNLKDYATIAKTTVLESIHECADIGADIGEDIGAIFGSYGRTLGRGAGTLIGGFVGFCKGMFG